MRRALIAAAVLLAVAAGHQAWTWHQNESDADQREAAVTAARSEVIQLISISATDSEKAFDKLLNGATAGFREDLRAQAVQLQKALASNKVEATGSIVSAGIAKSTGDQASVIIAATGTVANSGTTGPEKRDYRIAVELRRVDDRWLVSGLEFVA